RDGLVWSELGAALPGSGGTYHYLLECFGRERWGRLLAFLFIWQFLLSGPLELASGLIAMDTFAQSLSPDFAAFNGRHTLRLGLWEREKLAVTLSPGRAACAGVGCLIVLLLYRSVTSLARLSLAFGLAVLGLIAWILVEGGLRCDAARVFDFSGEAAHPEGLAVGLGGA